MKWHRQDMWYLQHVFAGLKYLFPFVLAMLLIPLLLMIMERIAKPRRRRRHKFVHPLAPLPEINKRRYETSVDLPGELIAADKDGSTHQCTLIFKHPGHTLLALSTNK